MTGPGEGAVVRARRRACTTIYMLELAIGALIVSLIAGALGFTGVARAAGAIAKIVFAIFLVIAIVLLLLVWAGISLFT